MRSYNNLYEKMLQDDYIRKCFMDAAKKKTKRRDVKRIIENLDAEVGVLKGIMQDEMFIPSYHEKCVINENNCHKTRRILKPHYKYEQVVHHLAIGQFKPIVMNGLYEFSCGSIPGRGIHYGKKFMKKWIESYGGKKMYVLKMDIHHFFESIDRVILKEKLRKVIRDSRLYRLLCVFIEFDRIAETARTLEDISIEMSVSEVRELVSCIAFDRDMEAYKILQGVGIWGEELDDVMRVIRERRKGVPLGYFTSQWFGNFYLKKLDHYIKQKLGAVHYMRYMDDMVVLGKSKKKLHAMQKEIAECLCKELKLELKGDWQVFRFEYVAKDGTVCGRMLDFMGFQFHRDRITMRKSTIQRARIKAFRIKAKDKITWYDAAVMLSYMGWFKHTDTYDYYLKYIKPNVNVKKLKKVVSKHQRKENEKILKGYCTKGYGDSRSNYHCWGGFWEPADGVSENLENKDRQCGNCRFSIMNRKENKRERLENSNGNTAGTSGGSGQGIIADDGISAKGHQAGGTESSGGFRGGGQRMAI